MSGIEELLTGHTLVDRYRIEEVIGRGGMGAVYRATDLRLEREVAVKVVAVALPDPTERERLRARFEREARAAARIRHPNVVTIYDFGTDPGMELDFLVMELLRGEDLAARLGRSGPPLLPAVTMLRDAARGIAAGHRLGMIHRDVKPGNLFLSGSSGGEQPRVTVLDFGIAQLAAAEHTLTHLTQEGGAPLSPAYASPEQLRGERNLTPASDVFSLGAIGFQLLTGERLFDIVRGGRRTGDDEVPVPPIRARNPVVPQQLEAIIRRALAHDPERRFPDAGALAQALNEAGKSLVSDAFGRHASSPPPRIVPPPAPAPPPEWESAATIPSPRIPRRESTPLAAASPGAPAEPPRKPETAPPPLRVEATTSATSRSPVPGARRARRRLSPALLAVPLLLVGALAGGWWLLEREPKTQTSSPPTASAVEPEAAPAAPAETAQVALGEPRAEESPAPAAPAPEQTPPAAPRQESAPAAARETQLPATEQPARASGIPEAASGGSAARLNVEGVRLFEQGSLAAAHDRFRRATELAPENAEFRNNYGWVLFRMGEIEAAEHQLRRVVELNPRREIAYANLGEVRAARGDTAEAIAMYERFLELNRDPRRRQVAERKLRELRGQR